MGRWTRRGVLIGGCLPFWPRGAAAAGVEPIRIGQTYIGSGPAAGLSGEPVSGIRALLQRVNRSGGVHGRPIELRQLDDANTAERAAANTAALAREGCVGLVMPIGTEPSRGALEAAGPLSLPVIGPRTGARQVYVPGSTVFPVRISLHEEGVRAAAHMALIGVTRIAGVRVAVPATIEPIDGVRASLRAQGRELVDEVVLALDGSDAAAKAARLAERGPQTIFLAVTNLVAARFVHAYRQAGGNSQFYATSLLDGARLYRDIGEAARGVVISQVVPSPSSALPLAREYRSAMAEADASGEPGHGSFEGYIAAAVLVELIRRSPPASMVPASVLAAARATRSLELGGLRIQLADQSRGALNFAELTIVGPGGRLVR